MKTAAKVLAEDFNTQPLLIQEYSTFMNGLRALVSKQALGPKTGEEIRDYALQYVLHNSLNEFDRFSETTYIRHYIGRDRETGWEALVMCWKKGNRTAIHSHPQYAGYTFADGEFLVEIFEPCSGDSGLARLKDRLHIDRPQGLFSIGKAGQFDNHIHRITCLSETAHSLHIYSDDALKGLKWEEK